MYASNIAIAAILNQVSRLIAFFSRTLHGSELKWPLAEKEACAISETIRHRKHITSHSFQLITDQKSVSFMLNPQNKRKIQNHKIYCWRTEFSCYNFDNVFHPGKDINVADTFSRVYYLAVNINTLY